MKNFLIGLLLAISFSNCKKDNSNPNIPADGWRVGKNVYSYDRCVANNTPQGPLLGASSSTSSIYIRFAALPTTNGTYSIVSTFSILSANQLSFHCDVGADSYNSLPTSVSATVTVANGIITVTIPETDVESGPLTTAKFAASIHEK